MKNTVVPWILVVVALAILIALVTPMKGITDPDWVSAVSNFTIAIVAVIGLIGLFGKMEEATRRRRKLHFDKLKAEVISWLVAKFQNEYQGIVTRTTHPLDWNNGQGLHWEPLRGQFAWIRSTRPADDRLYMMYYKDFKQHHYPTLVADVEEFERAFEGFKGFTLEQARELENEIRAFADLPESSVPTGERWFAAGNLALFAFNRIWMKGYSGSLTVRRAPLPPMNYWQIVDIGSSKDYAHGDEAAIRKLYDHIQAVISRQDSAEFTRTADELATRAASIQDALAEVRASVKLEGDCDATE